MTGIIDVGGGLRGIYGAGVFDWLMDHEIRFDYAIGVSAGAANLVSYAACQPGRNYPFYSEYCFRKEYMGIGQKIRTGNFLNLDYIYRDLSNSDGENPLDYEAMMANPMQLVVVATDAMTGEPVYFRKESFENNEYGFVSASSCVPWVNKPYVFRGTAYYDGGISDPIPVERAMADGCGKLVVIITRPRDFYRSAEKDQRVARRMAKKYPEAAKRLASRADTYNRQLDLCKQYEQEGRLLLVAPASIGKMSTLTRDKRAIEDMYIKGRRDAHAIQSFIQT